MSYCRFSDNDFQCDVYCYEAEGGYVINVAGNRPVLDGTLPPAVAFSQDTIDAWLERHRLVMEWVERAERRPIGLPYDGDFFVEPTAAGAANTLQMLKDAGYNVPQYAIDALREE